MFVTQTCQLLKNQFFQLIFFSLYIFQELFSFERLKSRLYRNLDTLKSTKKILMFHNSRIFCLSPANTNLSKKVGSSLPCKISTVCIYKENINRKYNKSKNKVNFIFFPRILNYLICKV